MKVLIAVATKYGSTREIARAIEEVAPYDAVVLGSAVWPAIG